MKFLLTTSRYYSYYKDKEFEEIIKKLEKSHFNIIAKYYSHDDEKNEKNLDYVLIELNAAKDITEIVRILDYEIIFNNDSRFHQHYQNYKLYPEIEIYNTYRE